MIIVHNTCKDRIILFQQTMANGICCLKLLPHFIRYFSLKNCVVRENWSFARGTYRIKLKFSTFSTLLSQKLSTSLFSPPPSRVPFFCVPPLLISLL